MVSRVVEACICSNTVKSDKAYRCRTIIQHQCLCLKNKINTFYKIVEVENTQVGSIIPTLGVIHVVYAFGFGRGHNSTLLKKKILVNF
jgi:hypothetical protein